MSPKVKKVALGLSYSGFYAFALVLFASLTFPYERLKDRILREFEAQQKGPNPMSLHIESIGNYWLTGIQAKGVEITPLTQPVAAPPASETPSEPGAEAAKPSKPKPMRIEAVHAQVSLLRLLFGTLHINFGGDMFAGHVSGFTSDAGGGRRVEAELEDLELAQAPMIADAVGLPLVGKLTGTVELALPERKLSKADGKIALQIHDLAVGDGKAKIRETIALPKVEVGDLRLEADATSGQLKISNFSAKGPDLEFVADGGARLRDVLDLSTLTLDVRFKFSERYANKNDTTRALLGTPGSKMPGLFDLDPKNSRAKRPDGFYAWRVSGVLAKPQFMPASSAAPGLGGDSGAGAPRIFQ